MAESGEARLSATPAARDAIATLRAAGGPVMFIQSGGCCAGSVPMCFPAGEFLVGQRDRLLGEVDGCAFYIDAGLDDALGCPAFELDIAAGPPEGFSLAAGAGMHFVSRSDRRCSTAAG
jgi:uncharacterized protein (DUF779 family)